MTAFVKLPRMLSQTANIGAIHEVGGSTVQEALADLFSREPRLANHIVDETGAIRPHVSVFVDGAQARLDTGVGPDAEIRVLHAVSGG